MKRIFIFAFAVLGAALPARAQEDYNDVTVTLGALQRDSDTISSKFLEYRDIPQGGVLPFLRFDGRKGTFHYDIQARDVTQKDQRYLLNLGTDKWTLKGDYTGIPHNFGNGGKSLLSPVTENEWRMSDTTQGAYQGAIAATPGAQVTYAYLSHLVQPGLDAAPANIDLKLQRGRGNLSLDFLPKENNFNLGVTYLHERRSGTRAANGTSFGFGNVVETPEPLLYITQDVGVNAAYKGDWGSVRGAVKFNDFKNAFNTFIFDNPFRATDGTDASAYQSPGSASKNGPAFGETSLPPDNKATTETVGGTFKFGKSTRLTADLAFGQWKQDHDPLLPYTTNTAILTPSGALATTLPLPAATLDGKIDTTSLAAFFTTRLTDQVGLNARYRHYDADNKTPRYSIDGYVRFDAAWEDIGRISVPYGFTNDMFDAYATFGKGIFGLEAGYKLNKMKRTFRETADTTENVFRVAADVRADWLTLHAIGEFGNRDYNDYSTAASEDASLLEPGAPANQTVLRRYDQAKRDLTRVGGTVEASPGSGKLSLFASYIHTKFKYNQDAVPCEDVGEFPGQSQYCPGGVQTPLGLIDDKYDTFTAEVNYTPGERVTVYAFYSYENGDILQDGRQSGSTVDFNPANVWTSNITNKGNTFGAGADFTLVPDKWFVNLSLRYQDINGNNDVTLLQGYSTAIYGTSPLLTQCVGSSGPCAIPAFDDTTLTSVYGSLRYKFAKQWGAGAGVGYEDYKIDDAQTGNNLNYMPASFFLQANNRGYKAWVGFLNLTYSNQ
jgi:hypothetical protein